MVAGRGRARRHGNALLGAGVGRSAGHDLHQRPRESRSWSKFAGLGYYAEIPRRDLRRQRVGPSHGSPTRTAQGDLISHRAPVPTGDTQQILLLPGSCLRSAFSLRWTPSTSPSRLPDPGLSSSPTLAWA